MSKIQFNIDIDKSDDLDNTLSKSLFVNKTQIEEYDDYTILSKYYVDLELPSKTLWCNYYLGVNPESVVTLSSEYKGIFYRNINCLENFLDTKDNLFFRSNQRFEYEKEKLKNIPLLCSKSEKFNLPELTQFAELIKHCSLHMEYNYNKITGLDGIEFISKRNGKTLFFPFNGYVHPTTKLDKNTVYFWIKDQENKNDEFITRKALCVNWTDDIDFKVMTWPVNSYGAQIRLVYNR